MLKHVFNPFLPENVYIPDGEPHVFGDRVYLFGSHDQEGGDSFCLLDYEGWSAPVDDLGKWESAGIIYSAKQDPLYSEERPYLYAPDVVQGNDGKFYLYYCLAGWKGNGGYDGPISVAVCDGPNGKYEYLGFVRHKDGTAFQDCVLFDPALINDDGVIRLYTGTGLPWGLEITSWNRPLTAGIASGMYHRPKSEFGAKMNPLGAYMIELEEDMMTVKGSAKRILPAASRKNGFKGHAFFEGASIRKIKDTYYFIYSSQKNHELCYATSKYPDHGFVYGGTIVSNGDVGYEKRKDRDRLNTTGTTHGSIECINGRWYVFYHRLSHGTDYSRQACAEPIAIAADGKIAQVEVSSCGLNGGPLSMEGNIPAIKACVITNGRMPHISNQQYDKPIPKVTHDDTERYITGITNGTMIGYRYFAYPGVEKDITATIRGNGSGTLLLYQQDKGSAIGRIQVTESKDWMKVTGELMASKYVAPLYLVYEGTGSIELLELSF